MARNEAWNGNIAMSLRVEGVHQNVSMEELP